MKKKLKFNVSSYTARLIGRENVSTLDGAIIELVKNTYDADASKCILYYDEKEKKLYLMDNGIGMTEDIIIKHWMTIGNSSKKENYVSDSGRIQTGAKGIGRFALDRISNTSTMFTKTTNNDFITKWQVNWSEFEKKENITDVTAEITNIDSNSLYDAVSVENNYINALLQEYFKDSGTIFIMEELHEDYNSNLIETLCKKLSSLLPPNFEKEFVIYFFKNSNDTLKEAKIISQNVDNYDYKIDFKVDKKHNVIVKLYRNEFNLKDKLDEIIKEEHFEEEDKKYFLGEPKVIETTIEKLIHSDIEGLENTTGTLYFNKITASKDDAKKYLYRDITGRQNYSKTFGGIKLYRDNFRVRPYGEASSSSYDWLLLGSRHSGSAALSHMQNPWKVAPNQLTGIVNISRTNIFLEDQANREGLIETTQFKALKELIIAIISMFEHDRQYVGRKLASRFEELNEAEKKKAEYSKEINKKSEINTTKSSLEDNKIEAYKAKLVIDSKDEEIKNLEEEKRMLQNLATVGIMTAQCIHETSETINLIAISIRAATILMKENKIEEAQNYIEKSSENIEKINTWFKISLDSIRRDKRKMNYIDVGAIIYGIINKWEEALAKQNIKFNCNINLERTKFKCFPYEIESILSNLIANSIHALRQEKNKVIKIDATKLEDGLKIDYSDNGPGLDIGYKDNPEKILEPFETSRKDLNGESIGTGMGMWIINNIVNDYNGKIDLTENQKKTKGFYISIILNSKRRDEND